VGGGGVGGRGAGGGGGGGGGCLVTLIHSGLLTKGRATEW